MTYNLSKPMDWKTFKNLPVELQREYLNTLIANYGTQKRICQMFDVCVKTFTSHLQEIDFKHDWVGKKLPSHIREYQRAAWDKFLGTSPQADADEEPQQESAPEEAHPDDIPSQEDDTRSACNDYSVGECGKAAMRFDSFTLNFSGPFDLNAICNSLASILQNGQHVSISISCQIEH